MKKMTFLTSAGLILALSFGMSLAKAKEGPPGGRKADTGQSQLENQRQKQQQDALRARRQQLRERREQIRKARLQARAKAAQDANTPLAKAEKEKGVGRSQTTEMTKAAGREHLQQAVALEKQLAQELEKHQSRVARLNRIKELAEQQQDAKTVDRVEKLLAKEQQRYQHKYERMQQKGEKVEQLGEKAADKNRDEDTDEPAEQ
jgi:hypothetical protein